MNAPELACGLTKDFLLLYFTVLKNIHLIAVIKLRKCTVTACKVGMYKLALYNNSTNRSRRI